MNQPWNHLAAARTTLAQLEQIKKDMDPASGVSFMVRRGVAHDNETVEDDENKRPWVELSLSNLDHNTSILDLLIFAAMENITFWEKATKHAIDEAQKVLQGT